MDVAQTATRSRRPELPARWSVAPDHSDFLRVVVAAALRVASESGEAALYRAQEREPLGPQLPDRALPDRALPGRASQVLPPEVELGVLRPPEVVAQVAGWPRRVQVVRPAQAARHRLPATADPLHSRAAAKHRRWPPRSVPQKVRTRR